MLIKVSPRDKKEQVTGISSMADKTDILFEKKQIISG